MTVVVATTSNDGGNNTDTMDLDDKAIANLCIELAMLCGVDNIGCAGPTPGDGDDRVFVLVWWRDVSSCVLMC